MVAAIQCETVGVRRVGFSGKFGWWLDVSRLPSVMKRCGGAMRPRGSVQGLRVRQKPVFGDFQ